MTINNDNPTVLIIGIGEVGGYLLEFVTRSGLDINIVAADVNLEDVTGKLNTAMFGAALHNCHPNARTVQIDLFDVDRTAELLKELNPTVVVNCAVLQTWHVIRRLPPDVYARVSGATLGAWLPVQLILAMRLAQAIQRSGLKPHFINTSLSDLTNPVLGAMGMPPTIGIGNVTLIEPAVRTLVARELGLSRTKVRLKMVAHHVHWVVWREASYKEGAPFFMKVEANGEDVTDQFDTTDLMRRAILLYPGNTSFSAVSGSSTLQNLTALLSDEPLSVHSPGPNGLPGGYPIKISNEGVAVDLPPELELKAAIRMNEEAQTFDGIHSIDENARVRFMPYTIEIMKEELGFDCESFTPDECEYLAWEQVRCFKTLEAKYS